MNATITKRQQSILASLSKSKYGSGTKEILKNIDSNVSRFSILRDLEVLRDKKLIKTTGKGRNVVHTLAPLALASVPIFDIESYNNSNLDSRALGITSQFEVLKYSFDPAQKQIIDRASAQYIKQQTTFSETLKRKIWERFVIEMSWKSSVIEGNTYSLLDTERLICEGAEAKGHSHEEAVMILNHKRAFEFTTDASDEFKNIKVGSVQQVHAFLTKDLSISNNLRSHSVGITGSIYKPVALQTQVKESLEKLLDIVNSIDYPPLRALALLAGISYIQPFEDDNKRTARLVSNAVLLAYDYPPLSYRAVNEDQYKKIIILFYEQADLYHLREMFVEQLQFSAKNYFS